MIDRAVALQPALEAFLSQDKGEASSLEESFEQLAAVLEQDVAA